MKKFQTLNLLIFLTLISYDAFSQWQEINYKVRSQEIMMSWDMSKIKSEKSFCVMIPDYHFKIGIKTEDDSVYIKRKVSELNAKKAGKGDDWLNEWNISKSYFLPIFIEGYDASGSKPFMPALFTNENDNSRSNLKIVLQPMATSFLMAASTLLMHADIVSIKEPYDTVARINFYTFYSANLSKKYPGNLPAAFYMAGEMMAKFFNKYIYKP